MHREFHPSDMHDLRAHAFGGEGHHHDHDPTHDHGHDHHDERSLYLLTATLGLLLAGDLVFGAMGWQSLRAHFGVSLAMVAALIGGGRIVYGAIEALAAGRIGADIALAQACLAALIIGEPFVAAEVVFIALVGEVLEAVTFARTQREIHRLLEHAPRTARVRRDGAEVEIPAGQVLVGDVVIVAEGERIAVDGPVLAGRSTVDQSALTGEAIPVDKGPGEPVYSGTLNQFGRIEVRAERVGHESTIGQVLQLVADAQRRKAPIERTADKYARLFLPIVEAVFLLTVAAGLILGWSDVWFRAVAVLVVACPCALVLATPATVLAAMAWLARHGVLIKGGAALERLAGCDTFAFDKTGTLTLGRPELASVVAMEGWSESDVLQLAATAEQGSKHPLAAVVNREAAGRGCEPYPATETTALPGAGVLALARVGDGEPRAILVGNRRLLEERGLTIDDRAAEALAAVDARGETPLLVALDRAIVGLVSARDAVRPEAHDVVHDLKHLHIKEFAILTGDRPEAARAVAKKVHLKVVEAELLPADKARWIEERQAEGRRVAMVGDGINDAPALARANVGIALGGIGADLAAEAGDIIVLGEPLRVLPDLVKLSRATVRIIRQNIIGFAFGFNAVAMTSAFLGILGPIAAAVMHQAGSLLVLLNAMRLLWFGDWASTPPGRWIGGVRSAVARWDDRIDLEAAGLGVARRWRAIAALIAIAGLSLYAGSGWTAIGPDEVGLLRRNGRYLGTIGPGLHLRWPEPFERVTRLAPGRVRSVEVGFRSGAMLGRDPSARAEDEAIVMTGDGQLVEVAASARYRLDPSPEALRQNAFHAADAEGALRPIVESSVRSTLGRQPLEALLAGRRREVEDATAAEIRQRAAACGLGIEVLGVAFQDVHPPLAVADAYHDVSRAESDRARRVNEGTTYRLERVKSAEGRAAILRNSAEGARLARSARASGEADSFALRADARRSWPALNDRRLYWETVASTLAGKPKILLDPDKARRHLILPDFPLGRGTDAIKVIEENHPQMTPIDTDGKTRGLTAEDAEGRRVRNNKE
jgi:Cu+-exporting ATPase